MIKLKISYEYPQELAEVLKVLAPMIESSKVKKTGSGLYRKAYIVLKGDQAHQATYTQIAKQDIP